jgi:hypothetical protein
VALPLFISCTYSIYLYIYIYIYKYIYIENIYREIYIYIFTHEQPVKNVRTSYLLVRVLCIQTKESEETQEERQNILYCHKITSSAGSLINGPETKHVFLDV